MTTQKDFTTIGCPARLYHTLCQAQLDPKAALARLKAVTTREGRRALAKEIEEECAGAKSGAGPVPAMQPSSGSKRTRDDGTNSDDEARGDDDPGEKGDASYAPSRREPLPEPRERAPEAALSQHADESEGSDGDDAEPPAAVPPPPAPRASELQLSQEEADEVSDTSPIPFPREASGVRLPEAQAMIDALNALKASSEGVEELIERLRPLLKPDAQPMEHQKRAVKFLCQATELYNVAGNGMGCGLGKTFTAILCFLHMWRTHGRRLGIVCGKAVLFQTWRKEIERVMPDGSYTVANVGPRSFESLQGVHVWKDAALEPITEALARGAMVFVYVQLHLLNNPHGVVSLLVELIDMAGGKATLMVEESHEQCRKNNVPCEALWGLSRRCGGTVFISATPVMGDGDEAKHMMLTANGRLPPGIDGSDALKVWRGLCFRAGFESKEVALPSLLTCFLRVPPVGGLSGLSGQARSRAAVHGNGVEVEGHTKYQAAVGAALALLREGNSACICAENRAGVARLQGMLRAEQGDAPCFVLSGDVPEAERQRALEEIQRLHEAGTAVCALITPQVGGAGLNLQWLRGMILVGLPWSKQDVEQVVARMHRIGQGQPCLCIALVTGAADQEVLDRVQEKMRSTTAFYGDHSGFILPPAHIEGLGVCGVGDVGRVVGEVRAALVAGGDVVGKCNAVHDGVRAWELFTRITPH